MGMQAIVDLIARHKAGAACGICSVCSAHPLVIEATFAHAMRHGAPFALIEATSNQVNQYGGYTGMTPQLFRDFMLSIADRVGLPRSRVLLGGDHLGPNAWTNLEADAAMARAEQMVADYVVAGFRKIHLDCSMSCADDPVPLSEAVIASRAARLCAVSEAAFARAGGDPPVYVIGTEVPVPGGAAEDLGTLAVTAPEAALATIDAHRRLLAEAGLGGAWSRVVGLVVQPGVEFDHRKVVDYDPAAAAALSRSIVAEPHMLFEAHSTDYQQRQALACLVQDHFAILKVGPGLTFALREALWALDSIERDWLGELASGFRARMIRLVRANPEHWERYYHGIGPALDFDLQYSLSDRIRYYWPSAEAQAATANMLANLEQHPAPLPLVSQYLPSAYAAIRRGEADAAEPASMVLAHISTVLDDYHAAVSPRPVGSYA
jgi:D-tagatose-1,6-bisphosphate aldolase subunit GatZ/KbaZ